MSVADIESKSLCIHKIEDLVLDPIFTIFWVQHSQVASRSTTDNERLLHFKNSMLNIRKWNSDTISNFYKSLFVRFPQLDSFGEMFQELQTITCKILTTSASDTKHVPIEEKDYNVLHRIIYECSDVFVSNPEWFSVEENSSEYQTCKNNANNTMKQQKIIENVTISYINSEPKETEIQEFEELVVPTQEDSASVSTIDEDDNDSDNESEVSDNTTVVKKINVKTGEVDTVIEDNNDEQEEKDEMIGGFSTFEKKTVSDEDKPEPEPESPGSESESPGSKSESESPKKSEKSSKKKDKKENRKKKKKYYVSSSDSDSDSGSDSDSDSDFDIPFSVVKKIIRKEMSRKEMSRKEKSRKEKSRKDKSRRRYR